MPVEHGDPLPANHHGVNGDRPREHRIQVLPLDAVFTAQAGESVMAAATRAGLRWPSVCGGLAQCLACRIKVDDDTGRRLAPMSTQEADALRHFLGGQTREIPPGVRLACQAVPVDDIRITKRGVKPALPPDEPGHDKPPRRGVPQEARTE